MDFATKQMKAMGWCEGKGLGLLENGITKAIKPNVQMCTRGLGFTVEDTIQNKNQWWHEAYNAASKGLKSELKITSVGVVVKPKKEESLSNDGNKTKAYNSNFVSAGLLCNNNKDDQIENGLNNNSSEIKEEKKKLKKKNKSKDVQISEEINEEREKPALIDFNDIFKKSDKMTCHKAARLGIKMNGKMKRIKDQEAEFLKKFKRS